MSASWPVPASEPELLFDRTLPPGCHPVAAPVLVPERHGPPLVVVPVRQSGAHRLLGFDLASGEPALDVAHGDAAHVAGPIAVADDGTLLVSACERYGVMIRVDRLDRAGQLLEQDAFERPHFESFPVFTAVVDDLLALPGGYALSWTEEEEPYDAGHTVRLQGGASGWSPGWIRRGNIRAHVAGVLVGHRVIRRDRVGWFRPIVGHRVDGGAELWSRAPGNNDFEQIFAGLGGVLLLNDERRRIARMPTRAEGPADTPTFVSLLDARSGAVRWQHTIDGFVASVCAGPEHAVIVVSNHDGQGQLARLDAAGGLQFSASPLVGPPNEQRHGVPPPKDWPRLVACDRDRVVWYADDALRCVAAADVQQTHWQLELRPLDSAQPRWVSRPEALLFQGGRRLVALRP